MWLTVVSPPCSASHLLESQCLCQRLCRAGREQGAWISASSSPSSRYHPSLSPLVHTSILLRFGRCFQIWAVTQEVVKSAGNGLRPVNMVDAPKATSDDYSQPWIIPPEAEARGWLLANRGQWRWWMVSPPWLCYRSLPLAWKVEAAICEKAQERTTCRTLATASKKVGPSALQLQGTESCWQPASLKRTRDQKGVPAADTLMAAWDPERRLRWARPDSGPAEAEMPSVCCFTLPVVFCWAAKEK